jgi:hypothetical protein
MKSAGTDKKKLPGATPGSRLGINCMDDMLREVSENIFKRCFYRRYRRQCSYIRSYFLK